MSKAILNVKGALTAHDYKKKGLNNREIGRAMKKDEKQIRRWLGIPADRLKKLSTG